MPFLSNINVHKTYIAYSVSNLYHHRKADNIVWDVGRLESVRVRVRVTLQLTVSQSVRLGVEPRLGLMTRYLFIYF
jgi:hypothetical protein